MAATRAFAERNVGRLDLRAYLVAGFQIEGGDRGGGDDGGDFSGGRLDDDLG